MSGHASGAFAARSGLGLQFVLVIVSLQHSHVSDMCSATQHFISALVPFVLETTTLSLLAKHAKPWGRWPEIFCRNASTCICTGLSCHISDKVNDLLSCDCYLVMLSVAGSGPCNKVWHVGYGLSTYRLLHSLGQTHNDHTAWTGMMCQTSRDRKFQMSKCM